MQQYLTVNEVAVLLRLHPITVRRYIKGGQIRAIRIGRAVRVPSDEVDRQTKISVTPIVLPEPITQEPITKEERANRLALLTRIVERRNRMPRSGPTAGEIVKEARAELEDRAARIVGS
jgi:excisionase family DNA binding protein